MKMASHRFTVSFYALIRALSAKKKLKVTKAETRKIYRLLLICVFLPATLHAQESEDAASSADDIARELADPNSTLGSLSFNLDTISYSGDLPDANDQTALKLSFQPALPYSLGNGMNLFVRPQIPVIFDQPVLVGGQNFDSKGTELGDISFDAAIGKSMANGVVLIGGVVGTLPTATDDALGLDQYLLGPEIAISRVFDWGVAGILVTHQWDVAGEDSFDTSITGGQYFFTYNLKDGWQISMSPTYSYNHNAASGDKLTLPVGIGLSRTMVLGGKPWKFAAQYWKYVETPDSFGPDWQIRFTVTPVVPLPW